MHVFSSSEGGESSHENADFGEFSSELSSELSLERERDEDRRIVRRIIAVGGGKGGVGKSLLAANIGIFLATLGKRVVLLDADLGGANLHTFVGVERPKVTLGDLFEKRVGRIEDVVVDTAISGLGLVAGPGHPSWIANPRPAQKFRVLQQVQQLDVDYLVIDLGPGSGFDALDFFLTADGGVLVVVPEPTSVENTYRFIKSGFLRMLRRAGIERPQLDTRDGGMEPEGGIPAPNDLYMAAREQDPALAERIMAEMLSFRPRIVLNQARTRNDLDLGPALVAAARRRLGLAIDYLGYLEHDDAVWLAVRKRRPLLVEHPESRAAKGIERITRKLLSIETADAPSGPIKPQSELTHYALLEIDPAATFEEIRRAYRRVREIYSPESVVMCGLYGRERLSALHFRIEESYDILMDAEKRRAYDLMLFPEGLPQRRRTATPVVGTSPALTGLTRPASHAREIRGGVEPASGEASGAEPGEQAAPAEPPPPEPTIDAKTEFCGAILRQIREARRIDLYYISQKTKIGVGHLRAIEDERFDLMPAPVYVRGFISEYAKILRLDVAQVLSSYLERYKAARANLDEEDR
ncbi:MAG: helix-turn-helix domain-containing protein [Pseudomonadota bacterium]